MQLKSLAGSLLLSLFAASAIAADSPAAPAAEAEQTKQSEGAPRSKPAQSVCMNRCTANDVKCGSEVRQARQECARNASMAGRDPLSMRDGKEYAYFCGFFSNPARMCGSDYYTSSCTARFQHRYGLCLEAIDDDVASMRFDCMKAEREANKMCRDELRDCKAVCEAEGTSD